MCWVKYVRRVQLEKNTTYHSTIGITPFEARYNRKPSFGLSDLGIPSELASQIHNEEDLKKKRKEERVIDEINNPPNSEIPPINELLPDANNIPSSDIIEDTDLTLHEVELPFQEPNIQNAYLDYISQPLPGGIPINKHTLNEVSNTLQHIHYYLLNLELTYCESH